ncbi:membrane protein [Pseudonocardia ammonioxydans]|uniref:Membrane protein n=1 Tax=Pseudonocardia ammonioxydans TaxID=260086 RepID=A0A1I5HIR4_PSUAM|nr:MmpS family transport accessory protein [Pseudonocardia ammonioxydans]SFO48029.1 membrane protein [Pseudonocardia ammonioxydans]
MTQVIVHGGGPVHDRAAGSGLPDDLAEVRPARGVRRRRGRTGRDDVRPARRRRWPWMVGAAAAIAAAVSIGLGVLDSSDDELEASRTEQTVAFGTPTGSSPPGTAPPGTAPAVDEPAAGAGAQPAAAQVTYEVTGAGSAGTITVGRGTSITQVSGAELPWQQTSPAAVEPTEYSVSAAGGSGEISCRIDVDGVVLSEESADGDYSAVSCSGRR